MRSGYRPRDAGPPRRRTSWYPRACTQSNHRHEVTDISQSQSLPQPPTSALRTSTSNSLITPKTTPRLSMNPLTATRNMRFVVARNVVCSTVLISSNSCFCFFSCGVSGDGAVRVKVRRTSGDSSASTSRVCRAESARRCVGNGRLMVLEFVSCFLFLIVCFGGDRCVRTLSRETRFRVTA